ncbi:MAG: hypothetical protein GC185_04435 [Alphaproteobacteria bacterium]|nr:hypothetical protein [Alphaproteobacteria bacterium]
MSEKKLSGEQKRALAAAMYDALSRYDLESLEGCIRLGGDPSVDAWPPQGGARPVMHWAAIFFRADTAAAVIAAGDVDCRDSYKNTALFAAISQKNPDAIRFFVQHGADPLAQNNGGDVAIRRVTEVTNDEALRGKMMQAIVAKPEDAPEETPKGEFNAAAEAGTEKAIRVFKPVTIQHKDKDKPEKEGKQGGFKL